jgi:hypothetical protein
LRGRIYELGLSKWLRVEGGKKKRKKKERKRKER